MVEISLIILLTLLSLVGCAANILGMPGTWFIVAMAAACMLRPVDLASHIGWGPLIGIIVVALIGEGLEFAASAMGVSRLGASKTSAALAILGSIGGAIVGLFAGTAIPVPLIGNLIGSLILGGVGAFAGAAVGERWVGKSWDESFEVGNAAFWGRLLGTVGKAVCGTVACGLFLFAIWM